MKTWVQGHQSLDKWRNNKKIYRDDTKINLHSPQSIRPFTSKDKLGRLKIEG